ncbi:MAG: hypothetical protein ACRD6X_15545, partial [Pyrinomonadaceae bacterium]
GYNPRFFRKWMEKRKHETKKELGQDFALSEFLEFFLGTHPPTSQRITGLKWEANWVDMPKKESLHNSPAFDAMKTALAKV